MRILHFPHELDLGGVQVMAARLLQGFQRMKHEVFCATLRNGPVGKMLDDAGIRVEVLSNQEELVSFARAMGAHVLHGHTCGGGSYACHAARELGVVGGETIHSMVSSDTMHGDFETAPCETAKQFRPHCTPILLGLPSDRLQVKRSRSEMRGYLGIPERAPVIGRHGRLDGSKAPDLFVEVLSRLPDVYGILVGWGPMEPVLRELAEYKGCADRLKMPGMVHPDQTADYINAMDVYVYPTHDELCCAAVQEAQYLQRPVTCFVRGAMGENVIDGKTALVAHNVDQMVQQVVQLFADPALRRALGSAARNFLIDRRQDDTLWEAQQYLDLYRRCALAKGLSI